MPHVTSNIPSKMFNAEYTVEVLRIARVTNSKTNFIKHCSIVISRMINKEGNAKVISKTLSKTFVDTFKLLVSSLQNH